MPTIRDARAKLESMTPQEVQSFISRYGGDPIYDLDDPNYIQGAIDRMIDDADRNPDHLHVLCRKLGLATTRDLEAENLKRSIDADRRSKVALWVGIGSAIIGLIALFK